MQETCNVLMRQDTRLGHLRQDAIDHYARLTEIVGGGQHAFEFRAADVARDLGMRHEQLDQRRLLRQRLATQVVDEIVRRLESDRSMRCSD